MRPAMVAMIVAVVLSTGCAGSLQEVPLESVTTGHPDRTFWLTFTDGVITEVCQQYRP